MTDLSRLVHDALDGVERIVDNRVRVFPYQIDLWIKCILDQLPLEDYEIIIAQDVSRVTVRYKIGGKWCGEYITCRFKSESVNWLKEGF